MLDEKTRELVRRKAHEIGGLMKRTAEDIIMIGENLHMVQQRLPEVLRYAASLSASIGLSMSDVFRPALLSINDGVYPSRGRIDQDCSK